jgi:pimeloyl-ACP methyl ester carboxylesterase
MGIEQWRRPSVVIALVLVLVVLVGACSPSRQDNPINIADPTPDTTSTTALSTEVPGSTPTGDLAFLGPVRTVPVGDLEIGYRQFGSGPPLVMVVGQDSSMSYWGPDLPRRLAEHFTVTMFDNRGVGTSTGQTDPTTGRVNQPLTIGQMADDTSGLLGALGLNHPTLFGWSTGGEIALALAVRHPDELGPVVLSGATACGPESTPAPPELDALLASSDPADQAKLLDELFTASGAAARDIYIQGLLSMPADEVSSEIQARQAEAEAAFAADPTVADGLPTITSRVLVTDGADDRLVPPANATFIAGRIPGAQLLLVPDTSHAWMLQQIDRFVATLVAFSAGQPLP